jgi:hypothetical protein
MIGEMGRGSQASHRAGAAQPRRTILQEALERRRGKTPQPQPVEDYYAVGLRPSEARAWRLARIAPKVAVELHRKGVAPEDALFTAADEAFKAAEWRRHRFPEEQARAFHRAGFTPEDAAKWRRALRRRSQLEKFASVAKDHPQMFAEDPIETLGLWYRAGFDNWEEALKWAQEWFLSRRIIRPYDTAQAAADYHRLGLSHARAWRLAREDASPQTVKTFIDAGIPVEDVYAYAQEHRNLTAQEAAEWYNAHPQIKPLVAVALRAVGATPQDVRQWVDRGHQPDAAATLCCAGVTDPDEAEGWTRVFGMLRIDAADTIKMLREAGVTPAEARGYERDLACSWDLDWKLLADWKQNRNDPAELAYWQKAITKEGCRKDAIVQLRRLFDDPKRANAYWDAVDYDLFMPAGKVLSDIEGCLRLGAQPEDIRRLREVERKVMRRKHGWDRPDLRREQPVSGRIAAWADRGFTPAEAADWWETVAPNADADVAVEAAAAYRKAGMNVLQARDWQTPVFAHLTPTDRARVAAGWARAGFTPRQAAAWQNKQITPDAAKAWKRAGVGRAKDAAELAKKGFTPERIGELRPYIDAGFGVADAARWQYAGFTPERAAEWKRAGVKDPRVAAEWRDAGVSVTDAARYESARN